PLGLDAPVAPEGREHLVLGLLPDGAGVEDDEIRPLCRGRRPVTDGRQRLAHPERVVDVHLAAEGVDEVALHGGSESSPDTRERRFESMAAPREPRRPTTSGPAISPSPPLWRPATSGCSTIGATEPGSEPGSKHAPRITTVRARLMVRCIPETKMLGCLLVRRPARP